MSAVAILDANTSLLASSFPYILTRKPSMCADALNKQWGNWMSADVTIGCTLHTEHSSPQSLSWYKHFISI